MYERNYPGKLAAAAAQNIKERNYWLKKLSGDLVKTGFPFDYKTSDPEDRHLAEVKFALTGEVFSRLLWLGNDSDLTLHAYLTAGVTALLNKYTQQKDIIVGVPIYKQEAEGEFINTVLALRQVFEDGMTFKELIVQLSKTLVEAVEHQSYPIEILVQQLNMPFSGRDFPLFDTAVLLENIHDKKYLAHIDNNMTFSFLRSSKSIEGTVEYNAARYSQSTGERIITHFKALLQGTLFNVDTRVEDIDILAKEEKQRILEEFNHTRSDYPRDKTVPVLFAEQVEKYPDKAALVFEDKHLTYRELNEKANALANVLKGRGAKPGDIIGLRIGRSLEMIIGIMGILKAGAAYLPLEPDMPDKRTITMLEDCQVSLLLTGSDIIKNRSFSRLQGLHTGPDKIKTTPYFTGPRPQITDFDGLPFPDRSLIDCEKYSRFICQAPAKHLFTLQGTRGCPFQCTYCHKIWPKRHVVRSAENIFEEVQRLYRIGVRRFSLLDDIFNLDIKNSEQFFRMLIKNKMKVQLFFPSGMRGDILTTEYIDLMVEAGLLQLPLALESASPRLQKLIGKNLQIEKLRKNIEYICEKHPHIILELYIMMGFPTETREEARLTLDFIKSIKWLHFPYIFILKIWSNTAMAKWAIEKGVSAEDILNSDNLAYHELPETLPFEKGFVMELQGDFFDNYFLCKERLQHVLPFQVKAFSEDEVVRKYDSYLPTTITCFNDLLEFTGLRPADLETGDEGFLPEECMQVPDLNRQIRELFPVHHCDENALKILLLDLSQFFSDESHDIYNVVEAPLGLMYLLTYLNRQLGSKVNGKIAKAFIDFDNYEELKALLEGFKPDVIGIRTLTYYKDFFHQTAAQIRQWGIKVPIIAGGPYATSNATTILLDKNIDLAVLGEGEITFCQLIEKIMANHKKLPGEEVLKEIAGIAFIPGRKENQTKFAREIILLDAFIGGAGGEPARDPVPVNGSTAQVYTMYTSGTTGKPKGTFTTHSNVIRVVRDTNYLDLDENDRVLQLSNYAFDGSVFDIYGALLNGSTLVMMKQADLLTLDKLGDLLKKERISVFFLTTALFNTLVDIKIDCFANIRKVLYGGEKISIPHAMKALERLGPDRLIHVYGPTETTVYATYYFINHIDPRWPTIPIGKPISNTTAYIWDKRQRLLPIGISGEIYIGGTGVAAGYLNQPELTSRRFVKNPYRQGEIVYRTGDIGRWLP
ncbi:MAG: AMP-binding protein, partial [Candidatus Aminicenantes bacterium]